MVNFANASVTCRSLQPLDPYKKVVDELPVPNLGPAPL